MYQKRSIAAKSSKTELSTVRLQLLMRKIGKKLKTTLNIYQDRWDSRRMQ